MTKTRLNIDKDILSEALLHTIREIELPNIVTSLENYYEELKNAHDSIHEFIYLAPLCVPSKSEISWHHKSAFLTYHSEAFYQAHRSFLAVLAGYYNCGYTLLRSTLELLIKGAFWECLAHENFRNRARVIKEHPVKIGKSKKTLLSWFEDIIKRKPSIRKDLEKMSAGIFDKIVPIPEDPLLKKLIPSIKVIITQLSEWGILNGIPESVNRIYNIYSNLSADIHVIPDRTDFGRRLLSQKNLFETEIIHEELSKFMNILQEVMDIGIVIELSILNDWINQNDRVKTKLKQRLVVIENLGLKFSSEKLKKLMKT